MQINWEEPPLGIVFSPNKYSLDVEILP